jgi:hypothetical protein
MKACLHVQNWCKGTDFVELVYNSELLRFKHKSLIWYMYGRWCTAVL